VYLGGARRAGVRDHLICFGLPLASGRAPGFFLVILPVLAVCWPA
jgi:hypothetical protein